MIRKILYGYQIQDGKLVIQPQEAEVVKRIFSIYLEGTYQWKIADILNDDGILYSQERPQWTMHRVGFILKNPRYMGADSYPVIIDAGTFQAAQEIIQKRKKTVRRSDRPALRYREKLRCGECGGILKRQFSGRKRKDTLYLQCEGCGIQIKIKDDDLLAAVDQKMETHTPSKPPVLAYEPSGDVDPPDQRHQPGAGAPGSAGGNRKIDSPRRFRPVRLLLTGGQFNRYPWRKGHSIYRHLCGQRSDGDLQRIV